MWCEHVYFVVTLSFAEKRCQRTKCGDGLGFSGDSACGALVSGFLSVVARMGFGGGGSFVCGRIDRSYVDVVVDRFASGGGCHHFVVGGVVTGIATG